MKPRLLAEWERQSAVLLAFPHPFSDWEYCLDSARKTFLEIIAAIMKVEECIICIDPRDIKGWNLVCEYFDLNGKKERLIEGEIFKQDRLSLISMMSNDTWARDFGPLSIHHKGQIEMLNFGFNGWGLKFASNYDNQISAKLSAFGILPRLRDMDMILEGGSIDSDGEGSILTTSKCLLEKNRNAHLNKDQIEARLKEYFGLDRVLWLESGYLAGDDTDSHIDTLARFLRKDVIAYVACEDENDEHYEELKKMEMQLKALSQKDGKSYELIPLPLPDIRESRFSLDQKDDAHRLPASYANFLILNENTLLLPTYGVGDLDNRAHEALSRFYHVIDIDCSVLIRQHGSLHCVSMQLPSYD